MMTSSNGNIFRVTGPLCGEFTGPRWIPRTKASDAELWCFLHRETGDLRRQCGHYDVIVMCAILSPALNSFCAGFLKANQYIYLQFISFLCSETTQMLETCHLARQWSIYLTISTLWLFMNWRHHQGPVSLRLMTSQFKDLVPHTQKCKTVKCIFFCVWVQNFVWNFKGHLWNFTQKFEPILRKIRFLRGGKNLTTYDILELWHLKS